MKPKHVAPCKAACIQKIFLQPDVLKLVTLPAPRDPTIPPMPLPRKPAPLATARYFIGKISLGIACTIEIVESVTPINMPPPMSVDIEFAVAETTAPIKAISGGIDTSHFRSSTSLSRPIIGLRPAWIRRGPSDSCQQLTSKLMSARTYE